MTSIRSQAAPPPGLEHVSRETMERLECLASLLRGWSRKINLVSPASIPELWRRHIADSAQLAALAPKATRSWLDLGAGAGFPGLVVAALRTEVAPWMSVTLIESDSRKCVFLREAAREMDVGVTVIPRRIEDAPAIRADIISARALAPLPRLLAYAAPRIAPDGHCLFPKGANAEAEIAEAEKTWRMRLERLPSVTEPGAKILRLKEISRVESR